MASHSARLDSPRHQNVSNQGKHDEKTLGPMSDSSSSRQIKRLQLRNAGFRGAILQTRKITPKSMSSSNVSSASVLRDSSDIENISPKGTRVESPTAYTTESSGILHDIGNSTITNRPKKLRPLRLSSKAVEPERGSLDGAFSADRTSPPPLKSAKRQHSVRPKAKFGHRQRSLSAETSKYIEHLESELAATQSRLSSVTSPSVTREQSTKMRNLNAETKQLEKEISEWESKYEHRVQEQVDKHVTIETDLRARIRYLEQDAEDAQFRIRDLETRLETTTEGMQSVEAANVNLERRLEIMSELLASTKVDLHVETPGRVKKQTRPRSMLPRFPTASTLIGSPERQSFTQPASPSLSHPNLAAIPMYSPIDSIAPLDDSPEQTDFTSEAESVFSEDSGTCDSMTSAENFDIQPSFNPWNTPTQRHDHKSKPTRRMRRFGAGSLGPKPLILPTASNCGPFPLQTAPPFRHSKTTSVLFPLPQLTLEERGRQASGRRRASTTANEASIANASSSPFPETPDERPSEDALISFATPPSAGSDMTTRRCSSFGAIAGRSLMDELSAVRSTEATDSGNASSEDADEHPDDMCFGEFVNDESSNEQVSPTEAWPDYSRLPLSSGDIIEPTPLSTNVANHGRTRSRSLSIPVRCTDSAFARLRLLFGELWRSPVAVARYLIQTAQARMHIPRTLLNAQWWLVGVLLGPMAKRRMLASHSCEGTAGDQSMLLEDTTMNPDSHINPGFGTLQWMSSTSLLRKTNGIAAKIKSRKGGSLHCTNARTKHSPWLWIKFSITLAFAIGTAFKDGPGTLLKTTACQCMRRESGQIDEISERQLEDSPA